MNTDIDGNEIKPGCLVYMAVAGAGTAYLKRAFIVNMANTARIIYTEPRWSYYPSDRISCANVSNLRAMVVKKEYPRFVGIDGCLWFDKKADTTIELTKFSLALLDWIEENTSDEWTITKSAKEVAFKNPQDAVMFKLVLAGDSC